MSNTLESSFEAILAQSPEQLAAYRERLQKQINVLDALLALSATPSAPARGRKAVTTAPEAPAKPGRKKRSASVAITIEDIVKQIEAGKTNATQIAKALGCNPVTVKAVIKKDGKSKIGHKGERRNFAYHLK